MRAAGLALVLLLAAGCDPATPGTPVACADLEAGCAAGGIRVRTDAPPSALRPFRLTVEAPAAARVSAEFAMEGMEMGLNRYRLLPAGEGRFEARVVLPVCVSGRRDWLLWVEADGRRVGFAFQTR